MLAAAQRSVLTSLLGFHAIFTAGTGGGGAVAPAAKAAAVAAQAVSRVPYLQAGLHSLPL